MSNLKAGTIYFSKNDKIGPNVKEKFKIVKS